jgi:excisionase family DNA binding protein
MARKEEAMATNGRGSITVKEAAETLGITDRAVRLRIEKGTLRGGMVKGKWLVYLPLEPPLPSEHFHHSNGNGKYEAEVPPSNAETQLQQVMSSWLQPLVDQIGSLQREVGSLEAQLEQERKEKAALIEALDGDSTYPQDENRPGFWGWLFGR